MSESRFEFPELLSRIAHLRTRLIAILESSDASKIQALVSEVPVLRSTGNDAPPLTVTFVGQYNAGKSTIISALTGKRDIPIDTDICTDTVTAYDWRGIHLLDTPGIHAEYPEHDDLTYHAIDRADLLVFVITGELFDDVIGSHFRKLIFKRNKVEELLLVVNKMGQDPGSATAKIPDLERVTAPRPLDDFSPSFIDALAQLEALEEEDPDDREQLFSIANFDNFVSSLNRFVVDRGLMGRLTTPLFVIDSVAQRGIDCLDVEMPAEQAALELLDRASRLVRSSKVRLREHFRGLIEAAASDVITYGDEVAEAIEPGSTEKFIRRQHATAQRRAEDRYRRLEKDARSLVQQEINDLNSALDSLGNSILARRLRDQVERALIPSSVAEDERTGFERKEQEGNIPAEWQRHLQKVGSVTNRIFELTAKWTTGPYATSANIGSATAARGSQASKVIYDVGKFFGVKFNPWGAVNAARAIGIAGRVISTVGGVLVIVAQIAEDKQQEDQRRQIRDARDSVRSEYRNAVRATEKELWSRFDMFTKQFHDSGIMSIDASRSEIVGERTARAGTAKALQGIRSEAMRLIKEIQTGNEDQAVRDAADDIRRRS